MLRRLLPALLLTAMGMAALADETAPPPAVPVGRERPRLAHNKWAVRGKLYSTQDMADAAAADITLLTAEKSPEELCFYRYLTLYNFPYEMRQDVYDVVTFLLNSLSRNDIIVRPAWGGPDKTLIRVNLHDYKIDPKVWDKIGVKDPYFHTDLIEYEITTVTDWETYQGSDGKWYYKSYVDSHGRTQYYPKQVQQKTPRKVRAVTSGGSPLPLQTLVKWTQSKAPILRADWFLVNFSVAPNYYDLLGLKKLEDFDDLIAFDKRAKRKEARATVVRSGSDGLCPNVARNNRILAYVPTFQGYRWETYDYLTSVGEQNVINNFLNQKRDAGEYIGSLPNGLQAYFLVDGKNNRVDEGDIKLVRDSMAHDGRVINGRSCIWCHAVGINPFRSNFQLSVGPRADQSNLGIYDKDPVKALEIRDYIVRTFGAPDFKALVEDNNKHYARAVNAAIGREPAVAASLFKQLYDGYDVEELDMPRIVYEVGLPEAEIKALIGLRPNGVNNGVLTQQLLQPPVSIRREHWEEAFQQMMQLWALRRAK